MRVFGEALQPVVEKDGSWSVPSSKVCCPVCGDSYQHHGSIIVFDRDGGEDGPTTIATIGSVPLGAVSGNPSPRRDAIRILFHGECGHHWCLDVVQHKGETFVFAHEWLP